MSPAFETALWVVLLFLCAPMLLSLLLTPFKLLEWLCEPPHYCEFPPQRDHRDLWPFALAALGVVVLLVLRWLFA